MFNFKHPEQLEGEVYFGNCTRAHFTAIGRESKRLGTIAYDSFGHVIPNLGPNAKSIEAIHEVHHIGESDDTDPNLYPVFVRISELEAAGINPEEY